MARPHSSVLRKLRKLRRDPAMFAKDFVSNLVSRRSDPTPTPHDAPADADSTPEVEPWPVDRAYDLELFKELNEAFRPSPSVHEVPRYDPDSLARRGAKRVEPLNRIHPLKGARVLEIGCGHGEVTRAIASTYPSSSAVGVDVTPRRRWAELTEPNAELLVHDISRDDNTGLGKFDFITAITVWEHVERPYSALRALHDLLASDGLAYLTINLYRGTQASHLYRDVFFPWPHLLFDDQVFRDYYQSIGQPPRSPAWVNKLVGEQYLTYFNELGLYPLDLNYRTAPINEGFYRRFEDKLGRYPRRDLERDYLNVVLTPSRARYRRSQFLARLSGALNWWPALPIADRLRKRRLAG